MSGGTSNYGSGADLMKMLDVNRKGMSIRHLTENAILFFNPVTTFSSLNTFLMDKGRNGERGNECCFLIF